jgi:hypothetical protein
MPVANIIAYEPLDWSFVSDLDSNHKSVSIVKHKSNQESRFILKTPVGKPEKTALAVLQNSPMVPRIIAMDKDGKTLVLEYIEYSFEEAILVAMKDPKISKIDAIDMLQDRICSLSQRLLRHGFTRSDISVRRNVRFDNILMPVFTSLTNVLTAAAFEDIPQSWEMFASKMIQKTCIKSGWIWWSDAHSVSAQDISGSILNIYIVSSMSNGQLTVKTSTESGASASATLSVMFGRWGKHISDSSDADATYPLYIFKKIENTNPKNKIRASIGTQQCIKVAIITCLNLWHKFVDPTDRNKDQDPVAINKTDMSAELEIYLMNAYGCHEVSPTILMASKGELTLQHS